MSRTKQEYTIDQILDKLCLAVSDVNKKCADISTDKDGKTLIEIKDLSESFLIKRGYIH